MRAKKASDDYLASKALGSVGSVSGASGSGDDEYYNNYNPVRTGGMLAPHGKAIAPASVKPVSPTPSQTQVCLVFVLLVCLLVMRVFWWHVCHVMAVVVCVCVF